MLGRVPKGRFGIGTAGFSQTKWFFCIPTNSINQLLDFCIHLDS